MQMMARLKEPADGAASRHGPAFATARVLVVGGAGFVGSNLVQHLLDCGVERIRVVDNLLSADRSNIPSDDRVEFVEGSIADDRVLSGIRDEWDYAFHLATYHGNQSSIQDPLADHENNTLTTLKLYESIKGFGRLKKVVYSSAGCSVAAKTWEAAHATTEDEPVSLFMDSPYSISKLIGELYSNYYFTRHKLPVVKARFQNVYGPREILGAGRWRGTPATVWRNVTPTFMYRALKGLPLVLDNGGIATRDFIYVDDIVEGLLRCALHGKPGEPYNLASGHETSIRALAEKIMVLTSSPSTLTIGPARDWDRSGKRFGSTEKSSNSLGFAARTTLDEGLQIMTDWTRNSLAVIENCLRQHANNMRGCNEPLDWL